MSGERALPLAGVRVLDFSQVQFGPMAAQTLADFGAEVIKVERPEVGDISRSIDQFSEGVDDSAIFASLNRNKRSIALDVKHPDARQVIDGLLAEADVLVENFRPGVADRLGIGYDELSARFPRLIHASGTGYGATGPLAGWGGQDIVAQSLSGAVHHHRGDDGRPSIYPIPLVDFGSGMALVQGILLALLERERSGRGQHVEVSLLDTGMFMQMQEYAQWMLRGREINWEHDHLVGVFRAADGWVSVVGLFRPHPLRTVCDALGLKDLSADPRFEDQSLINDHRAELRELLDAGFSGLDVAEILERLSQRDILCGPVLDYDEVLSHPQVIHNETVIEVGHPSLGPMRLVDHPVRLSSGGARPTEPPPLLGQHTLDVLVEAGLSPGQADDLVARGVAAVADGGDGA